MADDTVPYGPKTIEEIRVMLFDLIDGEGSYGVSTFARWYPLPAHDSNDPLYKVYEEAVDFIVRKKDAEALKNLLRYQRDPDAYHKICTAEHLITAFRRDDTALVSFIYGCALYFPMPPREYENLKEELSELFERHIINGNTNLIEYHSIGYLRHVFHQFLWTENRDRRKDRRLIIEKLNIDIDS